MPEWTTVGLKQELSAAGAGWAMASQARLGEHVPFDARNELGALSAA